MKTEYGRRVVIIKGDPKGEKQSNYAKYWIPHIPLFSALLIGGATLGIALGTSLFDVTINI